MPTGQQAEHDTRDKHLKETQQTACCPQPPGSVGTRQRSSGSQLLVRGSSDTTEKNPQKTQANGFLKGAPDRDMQVAQSARELDAVAAVGLLAH